LLLYLQTSSAQAALTYSLNIPHVSDKLLFGTQMY